MKKSIFLGLVSSFAFFNGCQSIEQQTENKADVVLTTQKSTAEYKNCVLENTSVLLPLTATETKNGFRLAKGEMGYAGVTIYIANENGITMVKGYIPSSSWAVIPKKMKQALNDCA
ncbi:hypothetical protein I5515_07340 [Acinetobacter calcoaceticus]|uniref:hypothetical protein n=1 Tax=Acinetobacter calcoaceticus TaxID=471 RepID=UPI001902314C|nr:hypothetical protein [Acinetobacter calcoaceticus]MBJ9721618.1 hypothetical protein [Acinetobacter calcoaceticus]